MKSVHTQETGTNEENERGGAEAEVSRGRDIDREEATYENSEERMRKERKGIWNIYRGGLSKSRPTPVRQKRRHPPLARPRRPQCPA